MAPLTQLKVSAPMSIASEESMPDYPVNEYFKDHVLNGTTVKRTAKSWVAVLLIADPRTEQPMVRVYEWKKNQAGDWKRNGVITLNKAGEIRETLSSLEQYANVVAEAQAKKLSKKLGRRKA